MRICRFRLKTGDSLWGELLGDQVKELQIASFDPVIFVSTGRVFSREDFELLSPAVPTQLIGIGDNYRRGADDLKIPVIFPKPVSSLVANHSKVFIPRDADVWGEPEIGIVIRKSCANLSDFQLADYILGFCLINDTTALFRSHVHDSHDPEAKGQPGFCQIGDFINTDFIYDSAIITGMVNNRIYRQGPTSRMKWDISTILREVTTKVSLKPFDVVFTGCPERVSPERTYLSGGEEFRVEVSGLGELITKFERMI